MFAQDVTKHSDWYLGKKYTSTISNKLYYHIIFQNPLIYYSGGPERRQLQIHWQWPSHLCNFDWMMRNMEIRCLPKCKTLIFCVWWPPHRSRGPSTEIFAPQELVENPWLAHPRPSQHIQRAKCNQWRPRVRFRPLHVWLRSSLKCHARHVLACSRSRKRQEDIVKSAAPATKKGPRVRFWPLHVCLRSSLKCHACHVLACSCSVSTPCP